MVAVKDVSEQRITSPETAGQFVNPAFVRHLRPFVGREASLAEAAQVLGIGKSRMSYWLRKLLRLGIVRQVRVEKRGKHPVPLYRAVADVFTVPLELVSFEANRSLLEAQKEGFDQRVRESLLGMARRDASLWHLRFSVDGGMGRLDVLPNDGDPEAVKTVNSWGRLRFTERQAAAFQKDLLALLERHARQSRNEGDYYLYKLVLVGESAD